MVCQRLNEMRSPTAPQFGNLALLLSHDKAVNTVVAKPCASAELPQEKLDEETVSGPSKQAPALSAVWGEVPCHAFPPLESEE